VYIERWIQQPNEPPIPQTKNTVFANGVNRIRKGRYLFLWFYYCWRRSISNRRLLFLRFPKVMGTTLALLSDPLRSDFLFTSGVIMFSF